MNWLTDFVKPKLQALVDKTDVPDHLWQKCPQCEQMIFHRDLADNLNVCPRCDHHMRLGARERLALLFDNNDYKLLALPKVPVDPLKFRDLKKYTDRLKENQTKTKENDVVIAATGTVGNQPAVIAAFNFNFMGGSMGMAVGEALLTAAQAAVERRAGFVVVPASGGARMQEGILSLMQMPRTTIATQMVKDAGLPYIVILTDPTTGGVSASFAMLGDVMIAEPGALIGFAGARVTETMREKPPANFQKAEYLYEHGHVDAVVPRAQLKQTLANLLSILLPGK